MRLAATSSRVRFQKLTGQALAGEQHTVLKGHNVTLEACALLCSKYDQCLAFSYHELTKSFQLSSALPTIPVDNHDMCEMTDLPEVFMKGMINCMRVAVHIKFPSYIYHS